MGYTWLMYIVLIPAMRNGERGTHSCSRRGTTGSPLWRENDEVLRHGSNEFLACCSDGSNHKSLFHVPLKGSSKLSLRKGRVGGGSCRERGREVKYYYLKHIPRHNKALKWKYCCDSFHYACSRPHYGISRSDCTAETWQYLCWIPIMEERLSSPCQWRDVVVGFQ